MASTSRSAASGGGQSEVFEMKERNDENQYGLLPVMLIFLNLSFHTPLQFVINGLFTKKLDFFKSYGIMKDREKGLVVYVES